MPIIKWDPNGRLMMPDPFEDMERIVMEFPMGKVRGFAPAVDVSQDKDHVYIETPLAGVDPKDVDITVENDILTIKGEKKKESEQEEKNYYRREIRSGSFYRSVPLPAHVVADQAEASSRDGMLRITIPKAPEAKPKTIKIKAK